jgi:hypothetical protein
MLEISPWGIKMNKVSSFCYLFYYLILWGDPEDFLGGREGMNVVSVKGPEYSCVALPSLPVIYSHLSSFFSCLTMLD